METVKQISAFLENKPGRLAKICSALARYKVNIQALTIMDSEEHSVLRLVTDDMDQTRQVLRELGTPFTESEVLLVEMRNQPGALAQICERLTSKRINIEYAYCSTGARNGRTLGVFRVHNMREAIKALNAESPPRRESRPGRRPTFSR